jgi:glycosyltransferase involved in cell wall biosynthesis
MERSHLTLVIKLHMSMTLIRELNRPALSESQKVKERVKSVLQPVLQLKRWKEFDYAGLELPHLLEADEISAPCRAIAELTAEMWRLDAARMAEVPYPFTPAEALLSVPLETATDTVGFIGRLEQRKGVIDLALAIPMILKSFPKAKFLFAGKALRSPVRGLDMQDYLARQLEPVKDSVKFCGGIEPRRISELFGQMDITVLPSLWENFPNVCLEAMAAGRAIVGSKAGGMEQQLDYGKAGLLIPPGNPGAIADAVCRLLASRKLRLGLAAAARARVLSEYNVDGIGALMEESYKRAIQRKRAGGNQWKKA